MGCLDQGINIKLLSSLGLMNGSTVVFIVFLMGVVLVVGHAQSRFDICKQQRQKTIECVMQFD
jgi:hypothetical protein